MRGGSFLPPPRQGGRLKHCRCWRTVFFYCVPDWCWYDCSGNFLDSDFLAPSPFLLAACWLLRGLGGGGALGDQVDMEGGRRGNGMAMEWQWNGNGMKVEWQWLAMEWQWSGIGVEVEWKLSGNWNWKLEMLEMLERFLDKDISVIWIWEKYEKFRLEM